MTQPNSLRAKSIMDAADSLHDALCAKYGENSNPAMYVLQASMGAFLLFCELERLEMEEEERGE